MVQKIELRVHAGAPSSRRDDDWYRALAAAYLGFDGVRTHNINVATQHVPDEGLPQVDAHQDQPIDDSTTILRHNETTFVEDTQLAFTVLESQLFTSSLTVPEVTPAKRSFHGCDDADTSSWPEDLEMHSPQKRQPEQLQQELLNEAARSSQPSAKSSPSPHSLGGRRCLMGNDFGASVTKPFKLPIKRTAAHMNDPEKLAHSAVHAEGQQESVESDRTRSSYLRTPVLDRSAQKRQAERHPELMLPPVIPAQDDSSSGHSRISPSLMNKRATNLPDYRERSPVERPFVPYVSLRKGSGVGLAFIGDQQGRVTPIRHSNETTSELPTTYSLSDVTTVSSRKAGMRNSQRTTSDPGPAGDVSTQTPSGSERSKSQPPRVQVSDASQRSEHSPSKRHAGSAEKVRRLQSMVNNCNNEAGRHNLNVASNDGRSAQRSKTRHFQDERTSKGRHAGRVVYQMAGNEDGDLVTSTKIALAQPRRSTPPTIETAIEFVGEAPEPANHIISPPTNDAPVRRCASSASTTDPAVVPSDESALLASISALPLTIRSPEPTASTASFNTHVTTHLRMLAESADLTRSYKPVSVTRELQPLERGHWLIDTSSCPLELQLSAWQLLEKVIGSGNAGWGVWCTRESDDDRADALMEPGVGLGKIKVFCWGEVVEHIYKLLYVASQSKVRKLGLQWFDAEGKVVVQMRSG